MRTFVLVHGAWHGSWCWDRLIPALAARGHRATGVELPCDQVDATTDDYLDAIEAEITDPEHTVLVGHSLAGLLTPIVAGRRTVRELVLLAALLPLPGSSWREQLSSLHPMTKGYEEHYLPRRKVDELGRTLWRPEDAAEVFYQDCTSEDTAEAIAQLRPQGPAPIVERTPLIETPSVPIRYIACTQDRAVSPGWGAATARERFGATVEWFDASHSPFWSRPDDLAEVLVKPHRNGPHGALGS
jgi:pimeloyl-ACP methyl ester carboxylesterase